MYRSRRAVFDLVVPLLLVGIGALAARLLSPAENTPPAVYLVPLGLAVLTGFSRPSLLGSTSAWVGWTAGATLGALIDTGDASVAGVAVYGLFAAFAPHAAASLIRVLLTPRETAPSG